MNKESLEEKMKRLKDLRSKREEARRLNRAEVVEEDRRAKEPKNSEAKKRRAEYELREAESRARCEAGGKDYDREKLKSVGADEAAALERRKSSKTDPDRGFSSYEEASFRKYDGAVRKIRPDMTDYEATKRRHGDEAFYALDGAAVHGVHRDTPEAIERMAEDVKKQVEKREKFSRRRRFNDDADIDYINERNMNFNKKLERFYGKYTKDIKDNLERGTAV